MEEEIRIRSARPEDAAMIAAIEMTTAPEFAVFIFEDLIPGVSAGALMTQLYAGDGPDGWRWTWIAEVDGETAGAMAAYPARLTSRHVDPRDPAAERLAHLAGFSALTPRNGLHISRLGVLPGFQRRGLARKLIRASLEIGAREETDLVSLFVWADNAPARALYEDMGFQQEGAVQVAPHPRLSRHGESLLLVRRF